MLCIMLCRLLLLHSESLGQTRCSFYYYHCSAVKSILDSKRQKSFGILACSETKVEHYRLAQKICLFPEVLREHLENRRTKLLNIRRDDVSKPIALLDQIQAQILSLKALESAAP